MTLNSSVTYLSILCSNIRGKFKDLKEVLTENALDFTFSNHFANGWLPLIYPNKRIFKKMTFILRKQMWLPQTIEERVQLKQLPIGAYGSFWIKVECILPIDSKVQECIEQYDRWCIPRWYWIVNQCHADQISHTESNECGTSQTI